MRGASRASGRVSRGTRSHRSTSRFVYPLLSRSRCSRACGVLTALRSSAITSGSDRSGSSHSIGLGLEFLSFFCRAG